MIIEFVISLKIKFAGSEVIYREYRHTIHVIGFSSDQGLM